MLNKAVQQGMNYALGQNLDNLKADATDMSEGESDMSKQIKERVQIGTDENGKPVYKWATGYSRQEVLLSAA